jgi:diguanylate cyclase (GGDEF)-like protein
MNPERLPPPPKPVDVPALERRRQEALASLSIVDTQAEIAYDDIARLAQSLCETPIAMVSLVDHDRQWFKARVGTELTSIPRKISFCDHAIRDPSRVLQVSDASADTRFRDNPLVTGDPHLRFYAGAPIVTRDGDAVGAVCVVDHVARQLSERQLQGLQALSRQVTLLLELRTYLNRQAAERAEREHDVRRLIDDRDDLQRRNADLAHVALHDELTGLLNRAGLNRLRHKNAAMSKLDGGNYAIAVLDLDLFKRINDRNGHLAGDRALQAVARVIGNSIRTTDVAGRYGGEEFIIVFPHTQLGGAFEVAERIRASVAACELPFAITVSVGLAAGDPQRDTPEEVFERADQALYRAKAGGRNRVLADDTPRH